MNSHYQLYSIANLLLVGLGTAAALVIVWLGWLRTRQRAYLVLAAWTISIMLGSAMQTLFYMPPFQNLFGGNMNNESRQLLLMAAQFIRLIISTVLLLAGLAMLVFGAASRRETPRTP